MTRDEALAALAAMAPPRLATPARPGIPARGRRAAVLVALVDRVCGLTLLLARRSPMLKRHAGEVSFPGGRIEAGESEQQAALREAREEVGLDPARVRLLGRLDSHLAGSGYVMAPHVGLVTPPLALTPDGGEIEEVFEVPLAFLLDDANHRRESMRWRGRRHSYSVFDYGRHRIWGATAAVVANLLRVLRGA